MPQPTATEATEMAKYGIVHFTVDYFRFGEFRYTNLQDAIAAGQRHAKHEQPIHRRQG